jgi:hypothetical protein
MGASVSIKTACRGSWSALLRTDPSGFVPVAAMPGESFQSRVEGVTQPANKKDSLSKVRRPDATSWKYRRPRGVTFSLQSIE